MSDHAWAHENLDAYLAGGLTPTERQDVEAHLNVCAECTQAVTESRKLEQTMVELFAKDRPDAKLEERAIARLRKSRITRATALRFVGAAAAVLVLGLLGAAMQAIAFSDEIKAGKTVAQNHLRTLPVDGSHLSDVVILLDDSASMGVTDSSRRLARSDGSFHWDGLTEGKPPGAIQGEGNGKIKEGKAGTSALLAGDLARAKIEEQFGFEVLINGEKKLPLALGTGTMAELDGKGRVQFAPVFNSPTMGWVAPKIAERMLQEKMDEKRELKDVIENLDKSMSKQKINEAVEERVLGLTSLSTWKAATAPRKYKYFTPDDLAVQEPPKKMPAPAPVPDPNIHELDAAIRTLTQRRIANGEKDKDKAKEPEKADPAPEPATRKLIRTGEVEFEVESFNKAADSVTALIDAVKGGVIMTANSDRLPNGKMRGSIVVRMPPLLLDKFLLDLRSALSKFGELRSQRIGSQDVSKQYTDTASELRAARAVETRLLEIIKTAKGEIKDLIAAENQLGIWRTKIEKMEGEIRYYDNQVGLSTLTITLSEKEIQAPSAFVVTDVVKMRIEVEQVMEAHKAALAAVKEAKGRVTKSEMKQHKAGQLEAILHAEIPPAQKDAFRTKLEELGIPTVHEETQKQEAEGGTGRADELKPRINEVQFEVALNNIVNIPPRYSVDLAVATTDVPGNFAKLKHAILQIPNGQVRDANLSEKDKSKVSAEIDFNVPIDQKKAIDELIKKIGPELSRSANQKSITEFATERKFGYKVILSSIANVPPREVIGLKIEVKDVDKKVAEMKDMVRDKNGRIVDANVARQENGQVTAGLVFEVPLDASELLVKQFKDAGNLLNQKTERDPAVPENELATARIVVLLQGVLAGKEPREKIDLRIEVAEVEKKMAEMKDKVRANNGRVLDEKSGLQANGQKGARLVFEVPLSVADGLVQQFKEAGKLVSYATQRNAQVPENDLASAQIVVVLGGGDPIVPSDESYFHRSLSLSYKVFAWCMLAILVGLSAAVPVGALVLIVYWLIRKVWPTRASATP